MGVLFRHSLVSPFCFLFVLQDLHLLGSAQAARLSRISHSRTLPRLIDRRGGSGHGLTPHFRSHIMEMHNVGEGVVLPWSSDLGLFSMYVEKTNYEEI